MMTTSAQTATQLIGSPDHQVLPQRVTLFDLFQQHVSTLSELPGGVSQFDQTDIGFEWHCEFEIGAGSAGTSSLQIHFHLIDLEQLPKPAAVLYLVEANEHGEKRNRLPLPLENLTETHEQLNEHLVDKGASIEMFEKTGNFVAALTNVKALLSGEVAWV
jgi:hypothetical protein